MKARMKRSLKMGLLEVKKKTYPKVVQKTNIFIDLYTYSAQKIGFDVQLQVFDSVVCKLEIVV